MSLSRERLSLWRAVVLRTVVLRFFLKRHPGYSEDLLRKGRSPMWELFSELFEFMIARKKLWLAPLFVVLALLGVIIVAVKGSVVAPFIYTLF